MFWIAPALARRGDASGAAISDVKLSHMYVDSAAMALVARPAEFDVVLTENMFGDILSDQAGAVVGSLACWVRPVSVAR